MNSFYVYVYIYIYPFQKRLLEIEINLENNRWMIIDKKMKEFFISIIAIYSWIDYFHLDIFLCVRRILKKKHDYNCKSFQIHNLIIFG